ncbi:hypothetical protein [Poseidonibacter ostreae]|jgi:hypothetical protein|uniref:hypothetical protein n=1 Tax=Poseidonibacter ostreae TaxID=2654171 RepID=UPI00186AF317|nr:hypothetical protein [Poseidonibacter ostreae]
MLNINIKEKGAELDIQVHVEENLDKSKLKSIEKILSLLSKKFGNFAKNKNKNKEAK